MSVPVIKFVLVLAAVGILAMMALSGPGDESEAGSSQPAKASDGSKSRDPSLRAFFEGHASEELGAGGAIGGPTQALQKILDRYDQASIKERNQLVHLIRAKLEFLEQPLIDVLSDGPERLLASAIRVCGRLQLERARFSMQRFLEHAKPEIRIAAVQSMTSYRFWAEGELSSLLEKEKQAAVLLELIKACDLQDAPPVPALIMHLGDPDGEVRKAAANAIPEVLEEVELELLCSFALEASSLEGSLEGGRAAISALSHQQASSQRDETLLKLAGGSSWQLRMASFEAIAKLEAPIPDTAPIWKTILAKDTSVRERVFAFYALEKSGSLDVERISKLSSDLHPVERLAAARCLVSAGDPRGIELLIDLLDTEIEPDVDDEDRICARGESLEILREVSQLDFGEESSAWRPWYRSLDGLAPHKLTTARRLYW